jgi:hypothetical protein
MLVFVDESGDQGLLGRFGSSSLFVMSAIIFVDGNDAYQCSSTITHLRSALLPHPDREFKFNKCARSLRCEFLREVCNFDFYYVSVVLDKAALLSSELQIDTAFYRFACKLLFDVAAPYIKDASIVIDGSGERQFRRELQNYLRAKMNTTMRIVRNVRVESSSSNNLLQLADMVCGAVARSFREDKEDRFLYRKLLGKRELEVILWPKKIRAR